MDGETIVGYVGIQGLNIKVLLDKIQRIIKKSQITPHKVDFSKDSDSDKSERKNLIQGKYHRFENENVQLKKKNTEIRKL